MYFVVKVTKTYHITVEMFILIKINLDIFKRSKVFGVFVSFLSFTFYILFCTTR